MDGVRDRAAAITALLLGVAGCVWLVAAAVGPATAADKVWVCKYVSTPGAGETLKEGKNPIEVSISAAGPVGSQFSDAQGLSYVIAISDGGPAPVCPATPPAPGPDPTCDPTPTEPDTTEPATDTPTTEPSPVETTQTSEPEATDASTEGSSPTVNPSACPDCPTTGPSEPTGPETTAPETTEGAEPGETDSPTGEATGESSVGTSAEPCPDERGAADSPSGGEDTSTSSGTAGGEAGETDTEAGDAPTEVDAGLARVSTVAPRHAGASVAIPRLVVDAPLIPVGADGTTLTPPADPALLGLWTGGARPGADRGRVVVVGHSVHDGYGALDDLSELSRGDRVVLRSAGRTAAYRVTSSRVLSKAAVAARAGRLFGQDSRPGLVLVSCTGWDGARYVANSVVVAVPNR